MTEPKLKVLQLTSPRDNYSWCGAVPLAEWLARTEGSDLPGLDEKLRDFMRAFAAYATHKTEWGTLTDSSCLSGTAVFYDYITDEVAFLFKESNNGQTYIVSHGYTEHEVSPA